MKARMLLMVFACFLISGCGMFQEPVTAQSCFIVEADAYAESETKFDYGRQLLSYLDQFAMQAGLEQSGSSAGLHVYSDTERGLRLSLSLAAGVRRASVALYVAPGIVCPICDEFEEFMLTDVGRDFTVIDCDDEEGFSTPVLYGPDLFK